MAAYNAARYIEAALSSLTAQTLDDLEVVVADDGSRDATAELVEKASLRDPRIRLLRLGRNRGQAFALNAALDAARGRYLALLDADDLATPTRLAIQASALQSDQELILVGGAVETFQSDRPEVVGLWRYAQTDAEIRVRDLFKTEFISSALSFDREKLELHGLRFDPGIRLGADWDLGSRAMRIGRARNLEEVVLRYRLHGAQMTTGMMDDLTFDSARIRREALTYAGAPPSDDQLRVHMAVSPCNYWPFGAHPFFHAAGPQIATLAAGWFSRLRQGVAQAGRVPLPELDAYLADLTEEIARFLRQASTRSAR
jgi:glycosyltransferase involved in cell wall biosynthesis